MANFYAFYTPGGSSANPSVGINGAVAPTSSTEVGGINPSGNLNPLQTTSTGALIVSPDPTSTGNVNLTEVGGTPISEGQKTMANSLPIVIASDQSAVHTIVDSSALPTGAATSALQTTGNGTLTSILSDLTNGTQVTQVSNFPPTQPVTPTTGTLTDRSGTTSPTPSTSTQIMAANSSRKYLIIENVSLINTIWINFTTSAATTQPSFIVTPGGSFVMEASFVSTEAVNIISTAASSPYTAKEA